MREFFRGWRRKIGVIMLVLACVLVAGWVRSKSVFDQVDIVAVDSHFVAQSLKGHFCMVRVVWGHKLTPRASFNSIKPPDGEFQPWSGDDWSLIWRYKLAGIDVLKAKHDIREGAVQHKFIISYWSIVIPLTVLSAWLLLSKPRAKPPATPTSQ